MSEIYLVYAFNPHQSEVHKTLVGKFVIDETGSLHVLENHTGILDGIDGENTEHAAKKLNSIQNSIYSEIVPADDASKYKEQAEEQSEPEVAPEETESAQTYQYHRVGMSHPQSLVFQEGQATLDGHVLTDVELHKILENVKTKKAFLEDSTAKQNIMKKSASFYRHIANPETLLAKALNDVGKAVEKGEVSPETLKIINSQLYRDTMIPTMGNLLAYNDMLTRPRQAVHIHMDLNGFKSINDNYGHNVGDQALKSAGQAIREAADESVGKANSKCYHRSGDEFNVLVPTSKHAAIFIRALKEKFSKIVDIGGTHKISASIGVGDSPESAEHALVQAKTDKNSKSYQSGQAETHVYSAIKGEEGLLP
jgi:diguanylate cyclase (GGDEF)-like protein